MRRPVGATQGVDLLRTDRVTSPMWRSVRVLVLIVCCVAALWGLGDVAASAKVWTIEGGTHYLKTDGGEVIKSWTAKEWHVWKKEVQSVGECMGVNEHCAAHELAGETPIENLPRVTDSSRY
jgi:hypothetical protein